MKLKHSIQTAVTGLTTHKSRSALTILGVVIGITSIILVMSLGQGAQNLILSQVNGLARRPLQSFQGKFQTALQALRRHFPIL